MAHRRTLCFSGAMKHSPKHRIDLRFSVLMLAVGVLTYAVHEGAHWLTGRALGYPVVFGLNGVTSPVPMAVGDHVAFSLSGPLITMIGALAAFLWAMRHSSLIAYGTLYFALFMRLVAAGVSLFHLNDEARSSQLLGLGTWTLPALVVGALAVLTVIASRRLQISWKVNVGLYVLCSVITTAIVGFDMALRA